MAPNADWQNCGNLLWCLLLPPQLRGMSIWQSSKEEARVQEEVSHKGWSQHQHVRLLLLLLIWLLMPSFFFFWGLMLVCCWEDCHALQEGMTLVMRHTCVVIAGANGRSLPNVVKKLSVMPVIAGISHDQSGFCTKVHHQLHWQQWLPNPEYKTVVIWNHQIGDSRWEIFHGIGISLCDACALAITALTCCSRTSMLHFCHEIENIGGAESKRLRCGEGTNTCRSGHCSIIRSASLPCTAARSVSGGALVGLDMGFRGGQMVLARFQVCTASAMPGLQAKPLPPAATINLNGNDVNCTDNGNDDDDNNDNNSRNNDNSNDDINKRSLQDIE